MSRHESLVLSIAVAATLLLSACRTAATAPSAEYPFDRTGGVDAMGLIRNPVWRGVADGASPCQLRPEACNTTRPGGGCTSEFLNLDHSNRRPWYEWLMPWKWGRATCVAWNPSLPGHLNLENATMEGFLTYKGMAFDGDYDIAMQPVGHAGITANNQEHVMLEFSSRETFNQFEQLPPWWSEFATLALTQRSPGAVNEMLMRDTDEPPFAVATGLLGLDCVHACKTEIHPVYALAVRTADDGSSETWQIFVRNWGTEGWCGRMTHSLGREQVRILLPHAGAASGGHITGNFKAYNAVKPVASNFLRFLFRPQKASQSVAAFDQATLTADGYVLDFTLDPSRARSAIVGDVTIQWKSAGAAPGPPPAAACPLPAARPARDNPEVAAERIAAMLPPAQQTELLRSIATPETTVSARVAGAVDQDDAGPAPLPVVMAETIPVTGGRDVRLEAEEPPARVDGGRQQEVDRMVSMICAQTGAVRETAEYRKLCGRRR